MKNFLSQIPLSPDDGFKLPGPLGDISEGEAPSLFSTMLSSVIGILTVVAAIIFVFKLISGAIAVITAGGDQAKLAKARSDITTGLVGFVIVIFSTIILNFIFGLLGIPNILTLDVVINSLTPTP